MKVFDLVALKRYSHTVGFFPNLCCRGKKNEFKRPLCRTKKIKVEKDSRTNIKVIMVCNNFYGRTDKRKDEWMNGRKDNQMDGQTSMLK